MKRKLTIKETITVASMLFGLFFGAGNLIFPVFMGQLAGRNVWPAIAGFLVTGVGLPLLGVAALGVSRSDGLLALSGKVSKGYGVFFTCALYLTIGPFFAIPRCATVPFEVGVSALLPAGAGRALPLAIFTLLFFGAVLWFSLKPHGILTWVGKILNPVFLVVLGVLVAAALLRPTGVISDFAPTEAYEGQPFFTGFLEGYNTMDALAGLAFGIVVVNVIRGLGVTQPGAVATNTVLAGVFSCLLMAVIYMTVTLAGAQSRGFVDALGANGGQVLSAIADHYFGKTGAILLALTVILACLKTAVGLITSCAETFAAMFPHGPRYSAWAVIFCGASFLIANLGLNAIIAYSLPALYFLYPLAITLILLALFGKCFGHDAIVYRFVTGFTLAAAVPDFLRALPQGVQEALHADWLAEAAGRVLPWSALGLGWIAPAGVGAVIGVWMHLQKRKKSGGLADREAAPTDQRNG